VMCDLPLNGATTDTRRNHINVWQIVALFIGRGVVIAVFYLMCETSLMQLVDEKNEEARLQLGHVRSFALLPTSMAISGILAVMIGARGASL
jgi:hypothetical protein